MKILNQTWQIIRDKIADTIITVFSKEMTGRILQVIVLLSLAAWVAVRLLNRRQKHTIHESVKTFALALLLIAAVMLALRWLQYVL